MTWQSITVCEPTPRLRRMTGLAIVLALFLGASVGANVVLVVWLRRVLRGGRLARPIL